MLLEIISHWLISRYTLLVLHLRHLRKKREQKPATSKKTSYDNFWYFVALVGPIMTLPQLYLVWVQKTTSGVSIASWVGYSLFNAVWIVYGLIHRDKPIILCNIAWVVVQSLVVLGVLIYK